MAKPVEEKSQEIESNVVEWHDDEGWTQEILLWILAWIEVIEEKHSPLVTSPSLRPTQNIDN